MILSCLLSDKLSERSTVILSVASGRRVPLIIALKFHAELVVRHPQVAVTAPRYRVRRDLRGLLGNHSDIGSVAAVIGEAIKPKPVVQIPDKDNVVLKPKIGPPSAATAAAATAATARHSATPATAARAQAAASTATAAGDVRMLPSAAAMRRSGARCPVRRSRVRCTIRRSRLRTRPLAFAVMRDTCSFVGAIALPDIGSATSWFRAGFCAGFEHLIAAAAAEVALTSISGSLSMIDAGLPSVAATGAADRTCGPIAGRGNVDVVAAAAPIDIAAPITS